MARERDGDGVTPSSHLPSRSDDVAHSPGALVLAALHLVPREVRVPPDEALVAVGALDDVLRSARGAGRPPRAPSRRGGRAYDWRGLATCQRCGADRSRGPELHG